MRFALLFGLFITLATCYAEKYSFILPEGASDLAGGIESELTLNVNSKLSPGQRIGFSVKDATNTFRFTDRDGFCKEVNHGEVELTEDALGMTITVGKDYNKDVFECTFDIETPFVGTTGVQVFYHPHGEEHEASFISPPFYSNFESKLMIKDPKLSTEQDYVFTLTNLDLKSDKVLNFHYGDFKLSFGEITICTDAEEFTHVFSGDVETNTFSITLGPKIQKTVNDGYTLTCKFKQPAEALKVAHTMNIVYDGISRSNEMNLPTFTTPVFKTVKVSYDAPHANKFITMNIDLETTDMFVGKDQVLSFSVSEDVMIVDDGVASCMYNDGVDLVTGSYSAESKAFDINLIPGMDLSKISFNCIGVQFSVHDDMKETVRFNNGFEVASKEYVLPAVDEYDPFVVSFIVDNTEPGQVATHIFSMFAYQDFNVETLLRVNVTQIISGPAKCETTLAKYMFEFKSGVYELTVPAGTYMKDTEVALTCTARNRLTAINAVELDVFLFEIDNDKNDKILDEHNIVTPPYTWPYELITTQTLTFELERHLTVNDYETIVGAYAKVHKISPEDIVTIDSTREMDNVSKKDSDIDNDYIFVIQAKGVSMENLTKHSGAVANLLKKQLKDVEIYDAVDDYEYPIHCSNGVKDGSETDVDCGGFAESSGCAPCLSLFRCIEDEDCMLFNCQPPFYTCSNSALALSSIGTLLMTILAIYLM